mmetsp:Transcript_23969/g.33522  ORF Transcript_23969/g.33522 Transcript_23969/m.33522 type:complete len:149 (+) Transcript_23969:951-1397(+)
MCLCCFLFTPIFFYVVPGRGLVWSTLFTMIGIACLMYSTDRVLRAIMGEGYNQRLVPTLFLDPFEEDCKYECIDNFDDPSYNERIVKPRVFAQERLMKSVLRFQQAVIYSSIFFAGALCAILLVEMQNESRPTWNYMIYGKVKTQLHI